MATINEGSGTKGDSTNQKEKKKEYAYSTEFRSEIPSESQEIIWKIENFSTLVAMAKAKDIKGTVIDKIYFSAGDSIGMSSKWRFQATHYESDDEKGDVPDRIGFFVALTEYKGTADQNFVNIHLTLKFPSGNDFFSEHFMKEMKGMGEGFGWPYVGTLKELKDSKILVDDTLIIHLEFTIYGNKGPLSLLREEVVKKKRMEGILEVTKDLGTLLESGTQSDFVIKVSRGRGGNEGKYQSFNVHKAILSIRSPVFKTMLEVPMQEKTTGEMIISDLSPVSMQVILKFIYSGDLDKEWTQVPEEVIKAADRYELTVLKDLCDRSLQELVTSENTVHMLNLCRLYNLPHGLKFVTDFIKFNVPDVTSLL